MQTDDVADTVSYADVYEVIIAYAVVTGLAIAETQFTV